MSRTLLNFWLDVTLLTLFLAELWLAFVVRFVFPPGTLAEGWRLWGWTYDQWCELQFGALCLFTLGILLHVMLHWTWICGVVTSQLLRARGGHKRQLTDGERTLYGVGLLVVVFHLLGLGLAVATLTVQQPSL